MKKILLLTALLGLVSTGAHAQRVTDRLDRGIVAVPTGGNYLVTWRKFGSEYYDTRYNLYRNGTLVASNLEASNYSVAGGAAGDTYEVEAVVRGQKQAKSKPATAWANDFLDVVVQPVVNRAGKTIANSVAGNSGGNDTTTPGYTLNDVTLADVTGDGICEFIVKRNNSQGNLNTAGNKTDFNLYECYQLDGTRLWWIDLGPNLMAGADEQWDLIAFDWDEDGRAECIMRGADNMIIHTAKGDINVGDMNYFAPRDEYTHKGREYLLYLDGATGEPLLGWDGTGNWTPMDYPLPRFEAGEARDVLNSTSSEYAAVWGQQDTGHRSTKHYFGAPYLDGRHASIFLGRGCYTRHKFCALDVNPATHELTQRWRWNCYDPTSPWFGNGFHNFQIADVDMDGRDEIMFGSMVIDDTGYGLSTTGLGHGDAQHCGDLDPYRWGLEQFTCQEGSEGNSYWNATTGQLYYRKADGGDDGRALAGNFSNAYPGSQGRSVSSGVIGLSSDKVINNNGDAMSGNYSNLNNRIYWDGDLLDEIFNSKNGANRPAHIFKWGGSQIREFSAITNNWTKCNPSAQGDILGDWREELVLRTADNSRLRIFTTTYPTQYALYSLWHDHQYRQAMAWQCVGYNQPPHPSFFLGQLEDITIAPPPLMLEGRQEVSNGSTITTTDAHLLISGYEDQTISVAEGASPYLLTVNAPAWVQGTGSQQAVGSTPKSPARTIINYTTTLTGGAFAGAMRLVKQGEGTLVLPAVVETYSGPTDVWQGTLRFDGTLQQSPLWLNRHTTLVSDGGQFLAGVKADYNATILPGGDGKVGTLKASSLALGFGSRIVFDIEGQTVDQLTLDRLAIDAKTSQEWLDFGPKYKSPVFQFNVIGELADGEYLLASVGAIEGDINAITLEGLGQKRQFLTYADGQLKLVVETLRPAADITWNGTSESNLWDFGFTKNFLNGGTADYSSLGDNVVFDDAAEATDVVIRGSVRPASVTFANETKPYVLTGDSIVGGATITKNGAGQLTILTENRTGATYINGGKLIVNMLANNSGQTYGSLGNARQRIHITDATLQPNGVIITDQPFTIGGTATIEVPTGLSFTANSAISGSGATLVKSGAGTMTTGTGNTYSRLVVAGGRVNAVHSGGRDQLPATVELRNGALWGANIEDGNGVTNTTNFVVPRGCTGEFRSSFRGHYSGTLTGEGTFRPVSGGVRAYWNGDWSQFEGTIEPIANDGTNRQNKKSYTPSFNFTNSYGLPKATLKLNNDFTFSNNDPANGSRSYDVEIGNVTGKGTLAGNGRYILGTQGADITADFHSASPIVKRGEGYLLVTTPGNLTGPFTLEQGELRFFDSGLEKTLVGSLTVKDGARVVGCGLLSAITLESGAEMKLCNYLFDDWVGFVKATALVTVNEGATLTFVITSRELGDAMFAGYSQLQGRFMTMNGTAKVVLAGSYTPAIGDEFTLWTISSSFSGTPTVDLPELPEGMAWDTSDLAKARGVVRIIAATTGISTARSDSDPANVYDLSGRLVRRLATDAELQSLPAGIYLRAGRKVTVR